MSDSGIPIIGAPPKQQPAQTVEVCRSFSRKINLQVYGGNAYESADFFASRKMECSAEDAGWVSQQIYEECVEEVREAMRLYIEDMKSRKGAKIAEQRRSG